MQTIFCTLFSFDLDLAVKTTPKGNLPYSSILFLLIPFPALPLKTTKPIHSKIPPTLLPLPPASSPQLSPRLLLPLLHFLLHLPHNLVILQMQFPRLRILRFAVIVVHYRPIIRWDFQGGVVVLRLWSTPNIASSLFIFSIL